MLPQVLSSPRLSLQGWHYSDNSDFVNKTHFCLHCVVQITCEVIAESTSKSNNPLSEMQRINKKERMGKIKDRSFIWIICTLGMQHTFTLELCFQSLISRIGAETACLREESRAHMDSWVLSPGNKGCSGHWADPPPPTSSQKGLIEQSCHKYDLALVLTA